MGLGNPGSEYEGTRHNVGADAVQALARRHAGRLRAGREHALVDEVRLDGRRLALGVPRTFMNESGLAVAALVRRFGIDDLERLVIVHDELDLEVGRIRVKSGGGLAGHNGLRSVRAHLHSDAFTRVRIGIGKPAGRRQGAEHVLSAPGKAEKEELAVSVQLAADAVEAILADGLTAAMNRFN